MLHRPTPMLLMILDGFGYSEIEQNNAVIAAHMPNWDRLWQQFPHRLISASGEGVGLPQGQMGNSEVGHLNLGAGRVVYQEFTRISKAIADKEFQHNTVLCQSMDAAIKDNKAVHIMGLLSAGGVHSHQDHIKAALEMAAERGATKLYLHAFLDGRDTPPRSAFESIKEFEAYFEETGNGQFASIIGRYYAMDRDKRWDRVELAYQMLTEAKAEHQYPDASSAIKEAYERDESDEFVRPTLINHENNQPICIEGGDAVIFMNFRADRARELSQAFVQSSFEGFVRKKVINTHFVSLTQYAEDISSEVAFKPVRLSNVLGEYISSLDLKQLRIAETEKYAHVTFFFNGGVEQPFNGESRELIPSPKVATYDLQPEMNAPILTDKLVEAIERREYDLIICNFANPDMVGHTGNYEAAVKALEALDLCIARIERALLKTGGEALLTADHGNVEKMYDEETGQPHTAHTSEPVPLIYLGRQAKATAIAGTLSDVAPTLLSLMNIEKPADMTGQPLFELT